MPVFISYSHKDKDFVDQLALNLAAKRVHIWVDRWEVRAGESLIDKLQKAISGASALLVILSKDYLKSEWCKKELNTGLVREMDEKKVLIVPVMKQKCERPAFLKEKKYADFTEDLDDGLQTVMEAIAEVTNDRQGRIDNPEWHTDWSIDLGVDRGRGFFNVTMVETPESDPYIVLARAILVPDATVTKRYEAETAAGRDHIARREIMAAFARSIKGVDGMEIMLRDATEQVVYADVSMIQGNLKASIFVRRLGADTGTTILFRIDDQVAGVAKHIEEVTRGSDPAVTVTKAKESKENSAKKAVAKKAPAKKASGKNAAAASASKKRAAKKSASKWKAKTSK